MADLRERNRGQILLVAAFALAVTFVALALVINSSIFTENLATRGEISGSGDAIESRHEVEQSVGEIVRYANAHNYSDSTSLEDTVAQSVGNVSAQTGQQKLRLNDFVNVTTIGSTQGTRIVQNDDSLMENDSAGGNGDWRVAESVSQTRDLRFNVTSFPGASNKFNVTVNETGAGTPMWNMSVWDDGSNVHVLVETGNGDVAECTRPSSTPMEIHVTEGLVDGEPCHALLRSGPTGAEMFFGTGVSGDYHIEFVNGEQIEGNYSLVTAPRGSNTAHVPEATDALYSVRVDYLFQNARIHYETEIRVAPGESP